MSDAAPDIFHTRKRRAIAFFFILFFICPAGITAQNDAEAPGLATIRVDSGKYSFYIFVYKDTKPDDVPQEVYDGLWEIQKEVIDNFTYDYARLRSRARSPYTGTPTKEDYYRHKKGVCEDYSNFFILLAREKGLTKNLYRVSGKRRGGSGHAWLEYRTKDNVYIIDPTWSDDYAIDKQARQKYRESPAYGRRAFFITYAEDKIIYSRQGYNHSSYTGKNEVPLGEQKADEAGVVTIEMFYYHNEEED